MVCLFLKFALLLCLGISLLVCGCGKKAETVSSNGVEVTRPGQTEIENYLEKQSVTCDATQSCPNYISKIVIVNGGSYKFCTGSLVEPGVIATSTTCLPAFLRLNGLDCSKDVFFFFPKTSNRAAERVGCSKVVQVSSLVGQDPILWRDDVAFLEMDRPLNNRRQVSVSRDGINNGKQFTSWMSDQLDSFSAVIKKVTCESVHNNYINPLASNESSPNLIFTECPPTNGGTGSPIIDSAGKMRALISLPMDSKLRSYLESTGLLVQGLKPMLHATNFACAPTPDDTDVLDAKECYKDLNNETVERFRTQMFSASTLFAELNRKLEESLQSVSKYVVFGVKAISGGDTQVAQIYPKCFKPLKGWLGTLTSRNTYVDQVMLPNRTFKKIIDPYGRVKAISNSDADRKKFVQFSLKNLRTSQKSSVLVWESEDDEVQSYPNITESCDSP